MANDYFRPEETPVTYLLVAANLIVYLLLALNGNTLSAEYMLSHGALNVTMVLKYGQWYRLFTAMFLHFGIQHLFNNMLLLFLLGQIFERAVGKLRYAAIYLGSGLSGSFLSLVSMYAKGEENVAAGASGAIFGIVGGMIIVVLVHKGKYAGITMRRMLFMALMTLYYGFSTAGVDNAGHVGGIIAGLVLTFLIYGIPQILINYKVRKLVKRDE